MAAPVKVHIEKLSAPDKRPDLAPLHPAAFAAHEKKGRSVTLSGQFADILALASLRKKAPHRVTTGKRRNGRHETQELSFHSLRHSAVSLLKQAGIPAAVVQSLIGHAPAEISEIYTTIGEDALTKAAAAFPAL